MLIKLKSEKGAALISCIIVAFILSIIATTSFNRGARQGKISANLETSSQSFMAAESAVVKINNDAKFGSQGVDNILISAENIDTVICNLSDGHFNYVDNSSDCDSGTLDSRGKVKSEAYMRPIAGDCYALGSSDQKASCFEIIGVGEYLPNGDRSAVVQQIKNLTLSSSNQDLYDL